MYDPSAPSKFQEAVALWLERKTGSAVKPDSIEFGTIQQGYCDTCAYETAGLRFRYTNGRYSEWDLDWSVSPGQFVAEVAEIAMGL